MVTSLPGAGAGAVAVSGNGDGAPWNFPPADGLYDPAMEKEACGVGFVVSIDGVRSHKVCVPLGWSLSKMRVAGHPC